MYSVIFLFFCTSLHPSMVDAHIYFNTSSILVCVIIFFLFAPHFRFYFRLSHQRALGASQSFMLCNKTCWWHLLLFCYVYAVPLIFKFDSLCFFCVFLIVFSAIRWLRMKKLFYFFFHTCAKIEQPGVAYTYMSDRQLEIIQFKSHFLNRNLGTSTRLCAEHFGFFCFRNRRSVSFTVY